MGFVATDRLRWGHGYIEIGEPVPEGEAGRDYDGMLRCGQIAEHNDPPASAAEVETLTVERDEAVKHAGAAEKALADAQAAVTEATAAVTTADETIAAQATDLDVAQARIAELEEQVEALTAPARASDPQPAQAEPKRSAKPKPGK